MGQFSGTIANSEVWNGTDGKRYGDTVITVVSGLPRSGTSLMMQMFRAGGAEILADEIRTADADNPRGYFEYEMVKYLHRSNTFLEQAVGKVMKVVSLQLFYLPEHYTYNVIFMRRDLKEILASQKKMLARQRQADSEVEDLIMVDKLRTHLSKVLLWLEDRDNIRTLSVSFRDVLHDPWGQASRINRYYCNGLDPNAMARVVDYSLYRQKSSLPTTAKRK